MGLRCPTYPAVQGTGSRTHVQTGHVTQPCPLGTESLTPTPVLSEAHYQQHAPRGRDLAEDTELVGGLGFKLQTSGSFHCAAQKETAFKTGLFLLFDKCFLQNEGQIDSVQAVGIMTESSTAVRKAAGSAPAPDSQSGMSAQETGVGTRIPRSKVETGERTELPWSGALAMTHRLVAQQKSLFEKVFLIAALVIWLSSPLLPPLQASIAPLI